MSFDLAVYLPILIIVIAILATSIRILREYEAASSSRSDVSPASKDPG